ncbi:MULTISPECIES: murein hydrolase activator EnvC family protein [Nitrosomonas]|uniref:Septal ring factor EnvC (AmiA/AmiB activator) n=2 Tax=Nitrosomonas eutropha TaxID=916 RepID=A0ABX5MCF1_9PROT|nr:MULTISPECIES: peptidoglycan DD-metalloendopeptidase family protein [Nitrosomonas]ABI59178.1 peptidase M23B [Nitrosomonas eutropha C91]MXS79232.1 peptidase M23 [Nitrosomonas sp. GH22]PXV83458.1 septal ring factor EnvC (AmiA/AmiB activator) [Nitrosomonas eutropha]SCX18097.1 Septal ring factor EnvC, activator of murein hydrolases AmiA and AmiB [Nitrosomonas eutropha]SDW65001.1 Septal ring factor EnvC, activator of murein hydrolases AmiA and AmiB [Nitrosomonas eutropha]
MFAGFIADFTLAPHYFPGIGKILSRTVCLLLLVNIFSSPLLYAIPQTNLDNQKQLHDLRTRIDVLQKDLTDKKSSKIRAADALRDSERSISDLHNKLSQLTRQQKNAQDKLARLQKKSAQLRDKANAGQTQFGKLIYYQHLTKHREYLQLLFKQQDPGKATRNFYYYRYIAQARSKNIDNLRNQLADLDTLAHASRIQNQSLEQIRNEQLHQKQQLELEKNRRSEILASLSNEVSRQQKKIDELKQDEQRLSKLIEKLNKQLARKKSTPTKSNNKNNKSALRNNKLPDAIEQKGSFAALKGKLRLPVRGELTNRFGSPRENGGIKWQGLFIRSSGGNEVKAIASGEVIFSDWLRGFGNLMILDHGNHYMSLYGNNEAIYKRVGNKVKSGDTIAIVGNSGGNAESGLYFELRYQGKPFDPLGWVKIE